MPEDGAAAAATAGPPEATLVSSPGTRRYGPGMAVTLTCNDGRQPVDGQYHGGDGAESDELGVTRVERGPA